MNLETPTKTNTLSSSIHHKLSPKAQPESSLGHYFHKSSQITSLTQRRENNNSRTEYM